MTTSKKTSSDHKVPKEYQTRGMLIRELALKVTNFPEYSSVAKPRIEAFEAKYDEATTEEQKALYNVLDNVKVVTYYAHVHQCEWFVFKSRCYRAIASALDDDGNCIANLDQITNIAAYTTDALWTLRVLGDPYEYYNPDLSPNAETNEVSTLLFTDSGEPKLMLFHETFSMYQCYESSKFFTYRPVSPCEAAGTEFVLRHAQSTAKVILLTRGEESKFNFHAVAHMANDLVTPQLEFTRYTFNNAASAKFVKLLGYECEIKLDENYITEQFEPHELDDMTLYDLDFIEYDAPSKSDENKLTNFVNFLLSSEDTPSVMRAIALELQEGSAGEDVKALYKMAAWFDDICKLEEISRTAHFHELGKLLSLLDKMISTTEEFGYKQLFPSYRELIRLVDYAQGTKDLLKDLQTKDADRVLADLLSADMENKSKPLANRYTPKQPLFEDVRLKARYKYPFINDKFYAVVDEIVSEKKLDKDGRIHLISTILPTYINGLANHEFDIKAITVSELRAAIENS